MNVTGVQTCALPICRTAPGLPLPGAHPRGQYALLEIGGRGAYADRACAQGRDRAAARASTEHRITVSMAHSEIGRPGLLPVLSSPSGAGKTTITRLLVERYGNLDVSISATTRPPRANEVDGQHYHFVSENRFDQMVREGALLEHAIVFGNRYGTPRAPVEAALAAGRDIVSDIDWQGTQQLAQSVRGDLVAVFILPPSMAALEDRLKRRAQDSD